MEFKTFFKYRKLYMGFAMLLLVIYHGRIFLPEGRVRELLTFCYGTVDFFLFCSGIGCFFSYTSDRNPAAFLKRRALRIYPVYLPLMLYWLRPVPGGSFNPLSALANLLGVQWLTGQTPVFNWYISALLLTYLLTPVFASLAEQAETRARAVGLMTVLLLFTIAFWNAEKLIIITTRLPLFFAGMLFAAESRRRERLEFWELAVLLLLIIPGALVLRRVIAINDYDLLWKHGMYWYPFLLIIPGACVLLALAARILERYAPGRWLVKGVSFVGGFTFEIFLTHSYAQRVGIAHYLFYATVYAAVLHLASLAVRKAMEWLGRFFRSRAGVS